MKDSELYHLAQIATITTSAIAPENKIKVLKLLFKDERTALYIEEEEAKKNATTKENAAEAAE